MKYSDVLTTVFLSLKIGIIATAVNLPLALGVVYFMTRHNFRGKTILDGIINLPLVMPPVTTGYLLLILLGKNGLFGSYLYLWFNIRIAFTTLGAVIASMVVSFPLIARSIRISIDMVPRGLEQAATTLGAGKGSVFFRVTLPLILPGIINGAVLGFARSLGEFGATMTFAGNIAGETRTIPLSVFTALQIPGREKDAGILVSISIFISFLAMFISSYLNRRLRKEKGGPHGASI